LLPGDRVIVVVGLGNMGLALARRLRMLGREVLGVDPLEPRRQAFSILAGGGAAAALGEVPWARVERVLVVVRTAEQMQEVVTGVVAHAERAGLQRLPVMVVTTIAPEHAAWLAQVGSPSVRIIENPITGGEAPALMGAQTAMLAGPVEPADLDFLRDGLMEAVIVFDTYGQPALAKLLNNLLCAYNLASFGAVLAIAEEHGLDPVKLRQVVVRGSGASYSARAVAEIIGDLLAKDVHLAESLLGSAPAVSPDGVEGVLASIRGLLAPRT
jgi:3-hydroxyisobutyrate dehydrogenase-like beta-hydroxyacid dehydrogenase